MIWRWSIFRLISIPSSSAVFPLCSISLMHVCVCTPVSQNKRPLSVGWKCGQFQVEIQQHWTLRTSKWVRRSKPKIRSFRFCFCFYFFKCRTTNTSTRAHTYGRAHTKMMEWKISFDLCSPIAEHERGATSSSQSSASERFSLHISFRSVSCSLCSLIYSFWAPFLPIGVFSSSASLFHFDVYTLEGGACVWVFETENRIQVIYAVPTESRAPMCPGTSLKKCLRQF